MYIYTGEEEYKLSYANQRAIGCPNSHTFFLVTSPTRSDGTMDPANERSRRLRVQWQKHETRQHKKR